MLRNGLLILVERNQRFEHQLIDADQILFAAVKRIDLRIILRDIADQQIRVVRIALPDADRRLAPCLLYTSRCV